MGSFRFRRSVKIAPGLRLNVNKRSVGASFGPRGARYSINSDGRRTRSVGVPGTGLSYRSQAGPTRGGATALEDGGALPSPTRLIAHGVGVLTLALFIFGVLNTWSFTGGATAVGIIIYVALRVLRPIFDPLIVALLVSRSQGNSATEMTACTGLQPNAGSPTATTAQQHRTNLADVMEPGRREVETNQAYIDKVSSVTLDVPTPDGGSIALSFTPTPEALALVDDEVDKAVVSVGGSAFDLHRQVMRRWITDTIKSNEQLVAEIGEGEAARAANRLADAIEAATSSARR